MEPIDYKTRIWLLVGIASIPFIFFVVGILFVGGSIYYLDCHRHARQINCVIATKFLGTFNTERREAIDVKGVVEGQDCDQEDCLYRLELSTSTGLVPLSIDYSPESKAAAIAQINAFLADTSRQTLRMQVVFWRSFTVSVVFSFLGATGLFWCLRQFRKLREVKREWAEVILPGEGKAHERPELLPLPDHLSMDRDINELRFRYRHPSWKGLVWLLIGAVLVGIGWMFLDPGESFIETAILFLLVIVGGGDWEYAGEQGFSTIVSVILISSGVIMTYVGLAVLINRLTIRVTYSELAVRYFPLPYMRGRRLQSNELEQLYIRAHEVHTRTGRISYNVLEAVLRDNRRVTLARELPYNVSHFIEVQIESWLGLKDRRVVGEVSSEVPAEELEEEVPAESLKKETLQPRPGWAYPVTAAAVAVGTLILPGFCLSVIIFTLLLELPWCPPELAQDTGLGEVFVIPGILYFPCAALFSGLLGYATFRISRSRLKKANLLTLAVISGVLSGLVFIVIYPVLITMLLCMV